MSAGTCSAEYKPDGEPHLKVSRSSHLAFAEEVFLPEREQDDVPAVSWVFEADVLSSVLKHPGSLVDDPIWAEERQRQETCCSHHVNAHIHGQVGVHVAGETDCEELRHVLFDAKVSMPVAALIHLQHQGQNLTGDSSSE